jgi:hypothetical protein
MEARLNADFRGLSVARRTLGVALCLTLAVAGCERGPTLVPVSGNVLMDGKPLEFGYVTFQPASGPPAQGKIESGGVFSMSSLKPGDGAQVGTHMVSVLSFEGHNPALASNPSYAQGNLGRSLIPIRYTRSGMSGLTVEVPAEGLTGHTIELTSKP